MNIKRTALGGFSHVKDDELLVRSNTVLQAMTDNKHFPDPRPGLEVASKLLDRFQQLLSVARRKGSPQDTAAKNEAKSALISALQQLAFYVSKVAEGNLQMLLSSGFQLSSYPKAGDVPELVRSVVLRDGKQSGQMRLDFAKQTSILLYEYRFAMEEEMKEGLWSEPLLTTSSRNNIMAPLTPFQRYFVQVRGVNGFGKSEWSEAVSHVIR